MNEESPQPLGLERRRLKEFFCHVMGEQRTGCHHSFSLPITADGTGIPVSSPLKQMKGRLVSE